MSLPSKILLVPAIGAALLIAGCGSSSNTSLTNGQAGDVGTEITANVLQNMGAAFHTGVEPAPAVRAAVATPNPNCTSTGANSESCTYTTPIQFSCLAAGTFTISGTYTDTTNTTTGITTVALPGINLIPTGCSSDNIVLITGDPKITVTGTGINVDGTTGNVQLPFTIKESGHVSFKPGTADPTFPTGQCDVNATATFQTTSTTSPYLVTAAVSGSVCGKTIPADTTIMIGSIP